MWGAEMLEQPVSREAIGKYVVFYNGCFAPRRDLKIVDVDNDGRGITFEWNGKHYIENIMHFAAIIDDIGDKYTRGENKYTRREK